MTQKRNNGSGSGDYFVRFSLRQRIEHILLIVTFTTLAVTGLAQRFYTLGPAEWMILQSGGIEVVRDIHRIFGAIFAMGFIYHAAFLTHGLIIRRSRQSMLPSLKDFTDIVDSLKYSLGVNKHEPKFGRYNYRQKFEYWGLMFGSFIITVTGVVLVFPIVFTRFLPGQVVAASVTIHGWEATLAVLTIVVWHLYEVVLRPDVFPADTTIFTGRMSRERLMKEHYLEYLRLVDAESKSVSDKTITSPKEATLPTGVPEQA